MAGSFFDRYDQFFETSAVGTRLPDGSRSPRLHNRYLGIVEANRSLFEGADVLDIGSHDGRWSLAALDAGARHVTGVEGRARTLETAEATFEALPVDRLDYRFVCADMFCDASDELSIEFTPSIVGGSYALILCLGFMYHTPRHWDLFALFSRLGERHIILDTKVIQDQRRPLTAYMEEPTDRPGCAIPHIGDSAVVGVPSRALIPFLAKHFGFTVSEIDWHKLGITDWRGCEDYREGARRTYVLTRR